MWRWPSQLDFRSGNSEIGSSRLQVRQTFGSWTWAGAPGPIGTAWRQYPQVIQLIPAEVDASFMDRYQHDVPTNSDEFDVAATRSLSRQRRRG